MSIATLKRKTNSQHKNMSANVPRFSINGGYRNQGWVGQSMQSRHLTNAHIMSLENHAVMKSTVSNYTIDTVTGCICTTLSAPPRIPKTSNIVKKSGFADYTVYLNSRRIQQCPEYNSIYHVDATNNVLVIDNISSYLPLGRYNVNIFQEVLKTTLPTGMFANLEIVTGIFTLYYSKPFIVGKGSSCGLMLGYYDRSEDLASTPTTSTLKMPHATIFFTPLPDPCLCLQNSTIFPKRKAYPNIVYKEQFLTNSKKIMRKDYDTYTQAKASMQIKCTNNQRIAGPPMGYLIDPLNNHVINTNPGRIDLTDAAVSLDNNLIMQFVLPQGYVVNAVLSMSDIYYTLMATPQSSGQVKNLTSETFPPYPYSFGFNPPLPASSASPAYKPRSYYINFLVERSDKPGSLGQDCYAYKYTPGPYYSSKNTIADSTQNQNFACFLPSVDSPPKNLDAVTSNFIDKTYNQTFSFPITELQAQEQDVTFSIYVLFIEQPEYLLRLSPDDEYAFVPSIPPSTIPGGFYAILPSWCASQATPSTEVADPVTVYYIDSPGSSFGIKSSIQFNQIENASLLFENVN